MNMQTWILTSATSLLSLSISAVACPEDVDADDMVGIGDLLPLLAAWGPCQDPCPADLDQSGQVDAVDLLAMLDQWGPCASNSQDPLFAIDFEHHTPGPYTEAMLDADWNAPTWSQGVDDGRVHIVITDEGSHALAVDYPEGQYGTSNTGAQWKLLFEEGHECLKVSYRLQYVTPFDFVKGGKLPGLIGGAGNTGGGIPDGTDGWSARMMWRTDGAAVQYVYHPDQPAHYGEDLPWSFHDDPVHFIPGEWHEVTHEIQMNTPGQNNGHITAWFDGELALDRSNMRFRDVDTFAIDGFYFSTFFGGGSSSWATTKDERILFDDVLITPCD